MSSETPHNLTRKFAKEDQRTELEKPCDHLRAETEQQIKYLEMAAKCVEELGYDPEDVSVVTLQKALDDSAFLNGRSTGDIYKPFDPDLKFPTEDSVKSFLQDAIRKAGLKPVTQPKLSL